MKKTLPFIKNYLFALIFSILIIALFFLNSDINYIKNICTYNNINKLKNFELYILLSKVFIFLLLASISSWLLKKRKIALSDKILDLDIRQSKDLLWLPAITIVAMLLMITVSMFLGIISNNTFPIIESYKIADKILNLIIILILYFFTSSAIKYKVHQGAMTRLAFAKNIDITIRKIKLQQSVSKRKYANDKETLIQEYFKLIEKLEVPLMLTENGLSGFNNEYSKEFCDMKDKLDKLETLNLKILEDIKKLNKELCIKNQTKYHL